MYGVILATFLVDGNRDMGADAQAMRTISLERMDRINFEMNPPTDR